MSLGMHAFTFQSLERNLPDLKNTHIFTKITVRWKMNSVEIKAKLHKERPNRGWINIGTVTIFIPLLHIRACYVRVFD